jgi:hypothetical protein
MNIFYCWVTALIPQYQDGIIAGMVKKGYMVGPAGKEAAVLAPGHNSSALISITVYQRAAAEKEPEAMQVFDDLADVLKEMKACYFSIIVTLSTNCSWHGANFDMPPAVPVVPPDPSKKTAMN